jgi:hypothetical protein
MGKPKSVAAYKDNPRLMSQAQAEFDRTRPTFTLLLCEDTFALSAINMLFAIKYSNC